MTHTYQLTAKHANALLLAAQGLLTPPNRAATSDDLLATIRQMSALQIDTIHVIARSPYFVLWSRLGDYQPRWLDELLADRKLFEYWSHEACFLPIEDYPLYRALMLSGQSRGWKHAHNWMETHREQVDQLLSVLHARGTVRSADFARTDGQASGWWNWKFEKHALEMLFMAGEVMIDHRENFQRIYAPRDRVLPNWRDDYTPQIDVARRELALRAVKALGLTTARWVADYFRTNQRDTQVAIQQLLNEGQLQRVAIHGWNEPALLHPDHLPLVEAIADGNVTPSVTTLLSPFDPIVWDRARALAMFGFDYRIECYTPAEKRRYGYFVLPILRRGELIGRCDLKAHRKEQIMEVKALYLEPSAALDDSVAADVAGALQRCANWHNTPEVRITTAEPAEFGLLVQRALSL
jgi:uncharacterized protein YcaQ